MQQGNSTTSTRRFKRCFICINCDKYDVLKVKYTTQRKSGLINWQIPCFYPCNDVEHKTSYISAKSGVAILARRADPVYYLLLLLLLVFSPWASLGRNQSPVWIIWCVAYSVDLEVEHRLSCSVNLVCLRHVVRSVHSRQPIADPNQQNAQCSSSDIYIIKMSIPTCYSSHGILIRKQALNNIA